MNATYVAGAPLLASLFVFCWCGQYLGIQISFIYMLYIGSLYTISLFPQKCCYEERRELLLGSLNAAN